MANELSITMKVAFAKSPLPTIEVGSSTPFSVTVSGVIYKEKLQIIGTTEEVVDVTDVPTNGWFYAKNLDPTNYLELGPAVSTDFDTNLAQYLVHLAAGHSCLFPLARLNPNTAAQQAIYARANTAVCNLYYVIFTV